MLDSPLLGSRVFVIVLVCAWFVQAGVITEAQFNLNTARVTQFSPDVVSINYGPSAISGSWTASASSASDVKASVTIGSNPTVEPDSYFHRVIEETPGGPSRSFYDIPAARVRSGYWDLLNVFGPPRITWWT